MVWILCTVSYRDKASKGAVPSLHSVSSQVSSLEVLKSDDKKFEMVCSSQMFSSSKHPSQQTQAPFLSQNLSGWSGYILVPPSGFVELCLFNKTLLGLYLPACTPASSLTIICTLEAFSTRETIYFYQWVLGLFQGLLWGHGWKTTNGWHSKVTSAPFPYRGESQFTLDERTSCLTSKAEPGLILVLLAMIY